MGNMKAIECMQNSIRRVCLISALLLLVSPSIVIGATYSIKVGSVKYIDLEPPAGTPTSATWSCGSNLTFTKASATGAIVMVTHYFTGTETVECTYTYTYVGTYDGNRHVGHGTATYSVECIGGTATISETSLTMSTGDTEKLSCSRTNSYGTPTWESSNEKVATVDSNGNVTAVGEGQTTITVDPISAAPLICNVTVQDVEPTAIELSPNPLSVVEGKTKTLTANLSPSGASAKITWKSNDESTATVNSSGVVTGVKTGTTTIVATTDNGLTATASVNVVSAPTAVSLPDGVTVSKGFYYTLTPTLTPSESSADYTWKSSDKSVATVTSEGKVYGVSTGTATITVTTDNDLTASTTVAVVSSSSDGDDGLDSGAVGHRIDTIINLVENLSK